MNDPTFLANSPTSPIDPEKKNRRVQQGIGVHGKTTREGAEKVPAEFDQRLHHQRGVSLGKTTETPPRKDWDGDGEVRPTAEAHARSARLRSVVVRRPNSTGGNAPRRVEWEQLLKKPKQKQQAQ